MSQTVDALAELIAVVARLRDPEGGCPWDLEQTHASLVPYLLEQVVLHAQIASEAQRFDLATVAEAITEKLVRRHPHVFAGAEAADSAAVRASWEAIKAAEKDDGPVASTSPLSDRLAGKVRGQPALAGAMTISRKAAAAGFEWDDMAGVWEKVHEELAELKQAVSEALASGDKAHAEEELGDVLFTLVNVARWCGIDPETAASSIASPAWRPPSAATCRAAASASWKVYGNRQRRRFRPRAADAATSFGFQSTSFIHQVPLASTSPGSRYQHSKSWALATTNC
jgi:XTP/dITP diphosphohydrolase